MKPPIQVTKTFLALLTLTHREHLLSLLGGKGDPVNLVVFVAYFLLLNLFLHTKPNW